MRIPVTLALALSLLLAAPALPQEKPKPASKSGILVINVRRIVDESDEGREFVAELTRQMTAEKQRLGDEAAKLQEKIKQLRETKLQDRTAEYYKELEKAMETQFRLETDKNVFLATKGDELARATQQLLLGATEQARAVMKERGAEVVLLTKTGPFDVNTDQEFQQELVLRRALCFADELDITDEVIRRMNEWYRQHKGAKPQPKGAEAGGGAGAAKETPKTGG